MLHSELSVSCAGFRSCLFHAWKANKDGSGFTDFVNTRGKRGTNSLKRLFKGFWDGSRALGPFSKAQRFSERLCFFGKIAQ